MAAVPNVVSTFPPGIVTSDTVVDRSNQRSLGAAPSRPINQSDAKIFIDSLLSQPLSILPKQMNYTSLRKNVQYFTIWIIIAMNMV